jgi:hypothetical protein
LKYVLSQVSAEAFTGITVVQDPETWLAIGVSLATANDSDGLMLGHAFNWLLKTEGKLYFGRLSKGVEM